MCGTRGAAQLYAALGRVEGGAGMFAEDYDAVPPAADWKPDPIFANFAQARRLCCAAAERTCALTLAGTGLGGAAVQGHCDAVGGGVRQPRGACARPRAHACMPGARSDPSRAQLFVTEFRNMLAKRLLHLHCDLDR